MITLEGKIVDWIDDNCPKRTDEALMDRFGISYNTLRKIEAGLPVRASLAERLRDRFLSEQQAVH